MLGVLIALVHFGLVIFLYYKDLLAIEYIYYLISIEIIIGATVAKLIFPLEFVEEKETFYNHFYEYWKFCKPLIPYVWLSVVMSFADTWLLRYFSGSIEQGYYAVAAQMGTVTLLFTSSVIRVLWKEAAEANENSDSERVAYVYKRVSRIVFMIGVIISAFLIPWTKEIIIILLGSQYLEGATVMMIMFLYPIHQSLGQINATMYFALELTFPYVVIGSVHLITSIFVIYFILAPSDAFFPGLGLGAIGLALKMVILQIICVNVYIWWLSRHQGWSFDIGYQVVSIGLFLILGFLSYKLANTLFDEEVYVLIRGSISAAFYALAAAIIFYRLPWLLGLTKSELKIYLNKIKNIVSTI